MTYIYILKLNNNKFYVGKTNNPDLRLNQHYNGNGYPNGLKGKNIPIEARILSIADAYEAMTSPRAYRKQMTTEEAIEELKSHVETQFDPELVEVFCKIVEMTPSWRQ